MTDVEALRAEQREVREAQEAVADAVYRVNEAVERIRSARTLGTIDTWFGGGLFTSLVKRDELDRADLLMRNVDLALATVREELADIGVTEELGGVGQDPLHRTLDVWFDNLFSDLATQSRIKDAGQRLEVLASALTRVQSRLGRQDARLSEQIRAEEG